MPQYKSDLNIAKPTRAFDPHALQSDRHRQMLLAVVEKAGLLRRPDQMPRQRSRFQSAALVGLAKLRHYLLSDATTDSHAAHKAPVASR